MRHEVASYNTRKLLSTTLKSIMKEKDLSKISISEVAEAAKVNRKTFYYHFNDIYDLLAWTLETEAINLVRSFDLTVDYKKAIKITLDYMEQNSEFMDNVMKSYARNEVRHFLYKDLHDIFLKTIKDIAKRNNAFIEKEYADFISGFSTEAMVGMIMHWVSNPVSFERAKVEKYLARIFRVTVENLIEEEARR